MSLAVRMLLLLALCWAAAVVWVAFETWPMVPMDLNPNDPEVGLAYGGAVRSFLVQHIAAGAAPLVVVLALWWISGRRAAT